MAVRKSVEDALVVAGPRERWLVGCKDALEAQGFTKVEVSTTLFQLKANYKKATIWGDLEVTLVPEGADATKINAKATANVDNLFAVFGSPGDARSLIASSRASAPSASTGRPRHRRRPLIAQPRFPWLTRSVSWVNCAIKGS